MTKDLTDNNYIRINTDHCALYLLLLGEFLRIHQYLFNRPLWVDESYLSLNIINKPLLELLFNKLQYQQLAPQTYLLITKIITMIFGCSEYSLRAFSLICGIVSLLLFYKTAKDLLNAGPRLIALFLFTTSQQLIYYSSEAKQYSLDVLIALILINLSYNAIKSNYDFKRTSYLSIAGFIAAWSSHSTILIFSGLYFGLLIDLILNKRFRHTKQLLIIGFLWGIGIFLYFQQTLHLCF